MNNDKHAPTPFEGPKFGSAEFLLEKCSYELDYLEFKKTGNGFFAVKMYLQLERIGINQPEWIKQWIVQGFTDYMDSLQDTAGLSDLSKSLGVATQTKIDRPKPTKPLNDESQDASLMYLMQDLMANYDIDRKMAAELVWTNEAAKSNGMTTISYDQLAKKYHKKFIKNKPDYKLPDPIKRTPADHRELLTSFLASDLRPKSKQLIKKRIADSKEAEAKESDSFLSGKNNIETEN